MPPQQQSASHRIRRIHRTFCMGWSPTDFTDLHRWLGCVDSSGGILPPPRPSYIRAIRAIRGRNILDVRGRPQNTLNTRKTIAERWTNTNYANKANNSSPTDGGWTQMLGCAEMNNGLRMWLSVAEVSGLRITKSAFVRFERFVFEKNA